MFRSILKTIIKPSFTTKIINSFAKSNKFAYQVVFIRHGESVWNKSNRFTGWTDVPLTE